MVATRQEVEQIEYEVVATDVSFEDYLEHYAQQRCEWVEGLVVKMSPIIDRHEDLRDYMRDLLRAYFALNPIARLRGEPFVMKLPEVRRGREPDLFVIFNDNPHPYHSTYMDGPADICIEIVSPGTEAVDHGAKFREYEQGGVREYWILDYIHAEARFYRLNPEGIYERQQPDEDDYYETQLLPKFRLHVSTLWEQILPDIFEVTETVRALWESKD